MSDPPSDPIMSWVRSGLPPDLGPPRRRLRWTLALTALGVALVVWIVFGGLFLFAMLMVLGLESGDHPEHSAEFTRLAGLWLVGTVVGVGAIVVMRRRTAPKGL